jgi:hypothetical protein
MNSGECHRILQTGTVRHTTCPDEVLRSRDETALTLQLVFKLPLRQTEGLLRSILVLMGLDLEALTAPRSLVAVNGSTSYWPAFLPASPFVWS